MKPATQWSSSKRPESYGLLDGSFMDALHGPCLNTFLWNQLHLLGNFFRDGFPQLLLEMLSCGIACTPWVIAPLFDVVVFSASARAASFTASFSAVFATRGALDAQAASLLRFWL